MTPATDTLPLEYAPAELCDLDLAAEVYEATAILEMGGESGIARHVADDLRRRRTEALRELVGRCERAHT